MGFTAATPNFIGQASDAISFAMGEDLTFTENGTDWNKVREAAQQAFFGEKSYNASKNMILNVIGTADTFRDAYKGGQGIVKGLTDTTFKLSKISKVGVALLILDIGLTILAFGLGGDFSGRAIAMLIATIIVSIALFAISLIPVVGWAIAAIIGLVDFILTLVVKDFTLTGWVAKNLASYFYQEEPLTQIKDFDLTDRGMAIVDDTLGYVVGNRFRITDMFEGVIEVVPPGGFELDGEELGAAALAGGFGVAVKVADEFDLLGRIQGGPAMQKTCVKVGFAANLSLTVGVQPAQPAPSLTLTMISIPLIPMKHRGPMKTR